MSEIEFKNHTEEFTRSSPLCDVIKVDGQLYVHISKVEIFQNRLQQKENIIKEVRDLFYEKCRIKDSDGRYSFNETDIDEFRNLLDKEVN